MLTNRLIACFDIKDGRLTKARQFQDNIDVGDPVVIARDLYEQDIDEIIFYDITASNERRQPDIATVAAVAREVFVPFTVGGGISSLANMHDVLDAGAEKISIDSMAVRRLELIREGAQMFGRQCIVLSMQVQRVEATDAIPSGFEIMIDGARKRTGMDAIEWARRGTALGAGEICVNSIEQDGTGEGFDVELVRAVTGAVDVPVIASGGAGTIEHIHDVFRVGGASAAIISSMLYSPRLATTYRVAALKGELIERHANVRPPVETDVGSAP
jgi:imidazole glycerol-phosphate synthase subunit HisF